jgi:hypothetical protein
VNVPLDEKALRRPEWAPGVPVKLGDGQTWELRKPRVRWVPVRQGDGAMKTRGRAHELGPDCDEILGVIFGDQSDRFTFADARFEIVCRLLAANYNLTDTDFQELLFISEEEDAVNAAMWAELTPIAAGHGPKPAPAT